jgi:hypothetical protein
VQIKAHILSLKVENYKDSKGVEGIRTVLKVNDMSSTNFDRYDLKIKNDVSDSWEVGETYTLSVLPSIFNDKLYLRLDIE